MSQGQQHSFSTLFSSVETVEIPIIQRDYAHGRDQAVEVRLSFLAALRDALVTKTGVPLDLDFIYGSFEADAVKALSLLDGQQRLTTLFLLHWYVAMREGQLEDFRTRWARDGRSRFTYATRPSSTEFFNALVSASMPDPDDELPANRKVSDWLIDSNWFFLSWRSDPTVNSCLAMLDAIQGVFGRATGLYAVLVDSERPRITFHFLNLEDFGLSDDLYIKMNARGMPLTPFENFKAWLVGRVAKEDWAARFDADMDQKWMDFFWRLAPKLRREAGGSVDEMFLRFLHVMGYFEACNSVRGSYIEQLPAISWTTRLRDIRRSPSVRELEEHNAFSADTTRLISVVLNYFCDAPTDAEMALLKRVLSPQSDYPDLVRLFAHIAFLNSDVESLDPGERAVAKARWNRVTSNLIANTRIDEPGLAVAAVKGLSALAAHTGRIYEALAADSAILTGFSREQSVEEVQKAALILEDPTREPLFVEAEAHGYLQGRIGFLVDFSKRTDGGFDRDSFSRYSARARAVLDDAVLKSPQHLLERALLSVGDYLVNRGAPKFSFCQSTTTAYRDRAENWLRVVGSPIFRSLLDCVGEDVVASLRDVITEGATGVDWRRYLVAEPRLIDYCEERFIHRDDASTIYLLSRKRLSGYFVELRSYAAYLALKESNGGLAVTGLDYYQVYGDAEPALRLVLDGQDLRVRYLSGKWRCTNTAREEVAMPKSLEHFMEDRGFTV